MLAILSVIPPTPMPLQTTKGTINLAPSHRIFRRETTNCSRFRSPHTPRIRFNQPLLARLWQRPHPAILRTEPCACGALRSRDVTWQET
jgi:hypothetical protein